MLEKVKQRSLHEEPSSIAAAVPRSPRSIDLVIGHPSRSGIEVADMPAMTALEEAGNILLDP